MSDRLESLGSSVAIDDAGNIAGRTIGQRSEALTPRQLLTAWHAANAQAEEHEAGCDLCPNACPQAEILDRAAVAARVALLRALGVRQGRGGAFESLEAALVRRFEEVEALQGEIAAGRAAAAQPATEGERT